MLPEEAKTFAEGFLSSYVPLADGTADVGFAAPFTTISAVRESFSSQKGILVGAQNVHWLENAAHTGEISVSMLKDQGVDFAIVGHSERRQFYGENDADVAKRAKAAIAGGLKAVVCIGETQQEFEAKATAEVVATQLKGSTAGISANETNNLVIAYEPVWAIGTGLAATPQIAAEVHDQIRSLLEELFGVDAGRTIPILYGGSTKPDNVEELLQQKNINGALVGGASLKPEVFAELVKNGRKGNCQCCCHQCC